jgi:hypothetical protein
MKHLRYPAASIAVAVLTAACAGAAAPGGEAAEVDATGAASATTVAVTGGTTTANAADHDDPADYEWEPSEELAVTLAGDSAAVDADGAVVDGSTVTLTAAGTYRVSGTLTDGRIVVDVAGDDLVRLILDGVDITSASSAPVTVAGAGEVVVILADGSENHLTDAAAYVFDDPEEEEPNAALFSTADLTIAGTGSLDVDGNFNDGIASKDGLVIVGGVITVDAVDDGIRGKDYLVVKDGDISVTAGGDGLKADNDEDASLGYVSVLAGTLDVVAGGDGIDAETDVVVAGGEISVVAGGGSGAAPAADASAKGIKGTVSVILDGGSVSIDSADDAVHSNGAVTIESGTVRAVTGDDGVHADATLTVNGGVVDVSGSYEGLESAVITLNGGNISIVSSDDGVNTAGGNDGSGEQRPGPGRGPDAFAVSGDCLLTINGGTLLIEADGDGIDANGGVVMTEGTVVVHGPTANDNGALDFASFEISGGLLVAAGSGGMAQAPGGASNQPVLHLMFGSTQAAGTLVHVQTADGEDVVTFQPGKDYQSVVVSSPNISAGVTYDVFVGGSAGGESTFGLYEAGAYTPGTEVGSLTA